MAMVEMRRGNKRKMQKYLRYRVAFQGVTVIAAVWGGYYYKHKQEHVQVAPSDEVLRTARMDGDKFEDASWKERLAQLEADQQNPEERERQNRELVMAQLIAQDQAREASKSRSPKVELSSAASQEPGAQAPPASQGSFMTSFTSLFGGKKQE